MFGVIIAIWIGLFQYIFVTKAPEAIWLISTNFLFWWYIVWSSVLAIIVFLVMLGIMGVTTFAAGSTGYGAGSKLLRGIGGFVGGGALSLLVGVLFFISAGLKIGGIYLLSTAVVLTEQGYVWNTTTLIFGTLALVVGLIMSKSSGSSSSSKS